ncbi:transposase [Bdellovibrio bacteriovorus]|uniref:transposase n=1 Tax=Bdellovibrio bacteriovorus TaxID=959 RepID=UPI0009BD15C2
MSNYLCFIHHAYKGEIYAFVLMSNHFHLLIRFPENNMSEAMTYFMRESSRMISRQAGRINQTKYKSVRTR